MKMDTSFREKHRKELEAIAKGYRAQLIEEVIPFWETRVLDTERGGYYNFFTREGKLYDDRKPGWFAGRTMHTFSALYNEIEPRESWRNIARAGRKFMDTPFYAGNGRFNRMLSRGGEVLEGTTSIFTDHFAVKGLYEYIASCGDERDEKDVQLARRLTGRLFSNVSNREIIGRECPDGMQKHAVNFMTLLVAQESRKLFGNEYQHLVDACIQRSLYMFANDEYRAPLEYLGLDGKPVLRDEGRIVDAGHMMEALWFAMQEGLTHENPGYVGRAGEIVDWLIERCYDEEYGGFLGHCDIEARVPQERFRSVDYGYLDVSWNDKIWWVQCEALLALAMSALLNQDERHYGYFLKLREFTESCFRDREYGEWYSFLKPDGSIYSDVKGSASKGPYHLPRCLMRLVLFLEEYLGDE